MDKYVPYDICFSITQFKETCLQFQSVFSPFVSMCQFKYGADQSFSHNRSEKLCKNGKLQQQEVRCGEYVRYWRPLLSNDLVRDCLSARQMARPVIKALFTSIALSWPTCFVLQENSGRDDEQQNDRTTSVVTVQIGFEVELNIYIYQKQAK